MRTDELLKLLEGQISADRICHTAQAIHELDQWNSFDKYRQTADLIERQFHEARADSVERLVIPCDGETTFGDWVMPLAWDAHEGTLERFTGDGLMIFFNDPVPVPNPGERAVRMALVMRDRLGELRVRWRKLGYDLDCGMGLAQGYATIGAIGFEGRWDYGAIGTVTNLAARLCGEAQPGQILVPRRLLGTVEHLVEAEVIGELSLKGFHRPITTYNILRLRG